MSTVHDVTSRSIGHGPEFQADGSITWRVWSPRSKGVELVLFDANGSQTLPMRTQSQGWFELRHEGSDDGQRYVFRLNDEKEFPDPASRWQPEGVHQPSALFRPDQFMWTDAGWQGVPLLDLVLYELHIGTFTSEGTLDAIIPRLPDLVELGITAIELMPLGQFPGERGWGYDVAYPFAVQNSYGGPLALQRLVNAAHAHGLAVFLDVIYNHLGPEGSYLSEFGEYFTQRYQTPWGSGFNFDDAGCDFVRQYVLENVRYWLEDFHIDGLRLDAVHAIFDNSPTHILREIQRTAEQVATATLRATHVIAESGFNDVRILDPASRGGYGLSGQWSDDFHHSVHSLLTDERRGYYVDFGEPEHLVKALNDIFVYDGSYSLYRRRRHGAPIGDHRRHEFVVSVQNHDQVGNRAVGDRFGTLLEPARQRLAAALMLLAPTTPLLFMGEEYGEEHPFPFFCDFGDLSLVDAVRAGRRREFEDFHWPEQLPDPQRIATFQSAKLSWKWDPGTWHAGLRNWYRELLQIRKRLLASPDGARRIAIWHEGDGLRQGILELLRTDDVFPGAPRIAVYFSFSQQPVSLPENTLIVRDRISWQWLLSSEDPEYGGCHAARITSNPVSIQRLELMPFETLVFGLAEGDSP